MNALSDMRRLFKLNLADLHVSRSLDQLFYIVMEHLGYGKIQILQDPDLMVSEDATIKFWEIEAELKKGRPIQYILGEAAFYGMKLKVDESVLIPRPETEELVDWVLKSSSPSSILDIGTGSACIPIALAKSLENCKITGVDVSQEALAVAQENVHFHNVNVDLLELDITKKEDWERLEQVDVIISNPPYIDIGEKDLMPRQVLDHEPHLALFAPLGKAMYFYDIICDFAVLKLNPNGLLYFELNEFNASKVLELIEAKGFANIELRKDLSGKPRMIRALK